MAFSLYLDENIAGLAVLLKKDGFDVLTAFEAGMANARITDPHQLTYATEQGRALVTFDVSDFEPLSRQWAEAGRHHAGIILCSSHLTFPELVKRIRVHEEQHPDGIPDLTLWA